MTRDRTGLVVVSAFGLVYVEANADGPPPVAAALRLLALAAFAGVLLLGLRRLPPSPASGTASEVRYGRPFWIVVAAEVVAGLAGIVVVNNVLDEPRLTVAWITFVVGVHFLALASVWRLAPLSTLGIAMSACGLAGLVLGALGFSTATTVIAGIIPGILLLSSATHWILTDPGRRS